MERPVERMLHPGSVHEYTELTQMYGFTRKNRSKQFDPYDLYQKWALLSDNARKKSIYANVRSAYPELLRTEEIEEHNKLHLYVGADAVYPVISVLTPFLSDKTKAYPYDPRWQQLEYVFGPISANQRNYTVKECIRFLEWMQEEFGLFDILNKKDRCLDILLLNDSDYQGNSMILVPEDASLPCNVNLTFHMESEQEEIPFEHDFFYAVSQVLYCLHYNVPTYNHVIPYKVSDMLKELFGENFMLLDEQQQYQFVIEFITEGMTTGTEMEVCFPVANSYPERIDRAKEYFSAICR